MRNFTFFSIAVLSLSAFADDAHQLFIPSRAHELLSNYSDANIVAVIGDAAVIQLGESQIEDFASYVHKELGGCGGFFDVSAEMNQGKSSQAIIAEHENNFNTARLNAPINVTRNENVARLVDKVDQIQIKDFLVELTSFDDRSATTDNGTRAAAFIEHRVTELGKDLPGFSVRKVATPSYPKQPSVVATLLGSNPKLPHIVIGGHMDTLSNGKPGADDDGSGSASVMEVLRVVVQNGARFENTIDFSWYAAEERGLVGSSFVVKDFKANHIAVAAAIQFDMTGWVNPARLHDLYLTDDFTDASLNRTLESIISTYLPKVSVGHAECGYECSDHASWTAGGVPAVYPFESHHDQYNRYIHTSSDTMDRLSVEHMSQFAKIGVAFLGQMASLR